MLTNTPARGARGQSWEGECSNHRAVPLKVRTFQGTAEGLSAEGFMLGHALCRSNSSSENIALAATPQIGGNPALDL